VPRLGLIGFGAIGRQVVVGLSPDDGDLVAILVQCVREAPAPLFTDIDEFLETRPDIVLEVAGPAALTAYAESILATGATIISVSASALVDMEFRHRLENGIGGRVYFAAGALGGIDALGSAVVGGLEEVSLRIAEPGNAHTLYQGDGLDGVRRFPNRLNVAALTAVVANRPVHLELTHTNAERELELSARGAFGEFSFSIKPRPQPHIVALSVLATLRRLTAPLALG
jgi:aspartate dehydrogenase